jgi:hypothetical protein
MSAKPKSERDLVMIILDLMYEAEIKSREDADRVIKEAGKDPAILIKKSKELARALKADYLRLKIKERKELLDKYSEKFRALISKLKEEKAGLGKRNVLDKWISAHENELSISFRGLSNLSDSALESIDTEEKLLELLSENLEKPIEE